MVTALKDENTLTLVFVVAMLLWGRDQHQVGEEISLGPLDVSVGPGLGLRHRRTVPRLVVSLVKLLQSQFEREPHAKAGKTRAGTLKPPSERLETTSIPESVLGEEIAKVTEKRTEFIFESSDFFMARPITYCQRSASNRFRVCFASKLCWLLPLNALLAAPKRA
jgi:hypothetical protein